ncbi:Pyridoxamine 5'-phosphate oxidase [Evansella caseinilytica]|uniref:Pyridoxamine 5'-phosphate oxidase n=1 Tax=Evansella caseinilytica TaxID=1503961 RepID=A0A1H3RG52_9BACI|nr:pyridoxamine 5'-phosphate oxidase family protein [Evansella caseinilytica]SDZ24714.1 Pyridoxamine 5'-phosphate oxidase [Evansella caseinilytica]
MAKADNTLSPELVKALEEEKIVSVVTIDHATQRPDLAVISWIYAHPEGSKVKFAVGHNAHTAKNLQENPNVTLGVIAAGSCYSIRGIAAVSNVIEKTMKLRVVTVDVESVEDVIFYGGKITVEPKFEKTYDPQLAKKLDEEVYNLLKA